MEQVYYTIEVGVIDLGCSYPCYWTDALAGRQFSCETDAITAAQGLGCDWWRIIKHVKTSTVVAKSHRYSEATI